MQKRIPTLLNIGAVVQEPQQLDLDAGSNVRLKLRLRAFRVLHRNSRATLAATATHGGDRGDEEAGGAGNKETIE